MQDANAIQEEIDQMIWEARTGHCEPEDLSAVWEWIEDLREQLENIKR